MHGYHCFMQVQVKFVLILSESESGREVERLDRDMNVEVVDIPSQSCFIYIYVCTDDFIQG